MSNRLAAGTRGELPAAAFGQRSAKLLAGLLKLHRVVRPAGEVSINNKGAGLWKPLSVLARCLRGSAEPPSARCLPPAEERFELRQDLAGSIPLSFVAERLALDPGWEDVPELQPGSNRLS